MDTQDNYKYELIEDLRHARALSGLPTQKKGRTAGQ